MHTYPLFPVISLSTDLNRVEGCLPSSTLLHNPHSLLGSIPDLSVETDKYQHEEFRRFMDPSKAL